MSVVHFANGRTDAPVSKRKLRLRHGDYTVAWICPLPVEQTAALEMLDEEHERISQPQNDSNAYHLGSIDGYNVVIAGLSTPGCSFAANVVAQMKMSFQNVKFGLLVGIGGGVPVSTDWGTVRLGDVVVGDQSNGFSGTTQYGRGKAEVSGFKCTSSIPPPPPVLLAAVKALESQRDREREDSVWKDIQRIDTTKRGLVKYKYPGRDQDHLFKPTYIHLDSTRTCDECGCDPSERVKRPEENEGDTEYVKVHRGNIASGDKVIKDAVERDQKAELYKSLCFETEAAGVFTDFHFLNIRGISDYCDSHKNNKWQGYAAAAAAAYARQLFFHLPVPETCNRKNISPPNKRRKISLSERAITKILKSLKFDQVDDRLMSIATAHTETCGWLLKTPKYCDWLGGASDAPHHGFLWIKGKPGAGKSTLMKFIVEHAMEMQNITVISFFFHARGAALEKTVNGMYRSLLLQLFTKLPKLQTIFCSSKFDTWKSKDNFEWKAELLKDLFRDAVKSLGESSVMCFIDALDECDESEARKIVTFIHDLSKKSAVEQNGNFRVCVASRHYPNISLPAGHIELHLDHQAGHADDIIKYIASELRIGEDNTANEIRDEIRRKSSGVFMWVVLVVERLNWERDEGCSLRGLRDTLQAIPDDLHQLFRDILTRDKNKNEEFVLCMQWLLFAEWPLSPRELYLAILSGTNFNVEDLREGANRPIDTIMKFLLKCSRGLAEKTKYKYPTMQFIHQSVPDFLLAEDGLELLSPALKTNMLGQSHERLKQCCLNYIESDTLSPDEQWRDIPPMDEEFPFMFHARQYALYHADVAEEAGISQAQFIANIRGDKWYNRTTKISLLLSLTAMNLPHLIRIHPSNLSYLDKEAVTGYSPLLIPFRRGGSHAAVMAFLEAQAKALPENPRLQSLFRSLCNKRFPDPDPEDGYFHGVSPLAHAALYWPPTLLDFLLETGRWMPDSRDEEGRSLLSQVISVVRVEPVVVRLLLEKYKVDPNSQDNLGRTPLAHAAENEGTEEVVELLLRNPNVNPDISDSRGRTPLVYATRSLHNPVPIVKLLLETRRVDPNSRDNNGRTALSFAAQVGYHEVIQLLLSTGKVDVDAEDHVGRTPLSYAAQNGYHEGIQQLLSTSKVDVDSNDCTGRTPLSYAAWDGHYNAIEVLLDIGGADVDAKDHFGQTPLSYAAWGGQHEVIQQLLSTDKVDVDAKDRMNRTPLSYAAEKGHHEVIQQLLSTGKVDVDAKDHMGRTSLSYAAEDGHHEVIQLLLFTGKVDIDSEDDNNMTALDYAEQSRDPDTLNLLLQARKVHPPQFPNKRGRHMPENEEDQMQLYKVNSEC
ncbi:hypothetical protein EMPG_12626 [Blastomyces silverae]|uniref:Nephrocystin 3-like N-terminal domain-containing protein n=1 Tax=Blastomyces silverae TaxID=2060906 RepID=A0A0H1BMT1_9EURO|nr:hypothetical protein EMPG_12626 [Blastomyces silverae]